MRHLQTAGACTFGAGECAADVAKQFGMQRRRIGGEACAIDRNELAGAARTLMDETGAERFSAAGRTDEDNEFAIDNIKGEAMDDTVRAVSLDDVLNGKSGHGIIL